MNYYDLSDREIVVEVEKYLKGTGEYAERLACEKADNIPLWIYKRAKRNIREEENKKRDSELQEKEAKQREQEEHSAKDAEQRKKMFEDDEDENEEDVEYFSPAMGK